MLNSRNYSSEDGVINVGQEIAPDLEALKDPSARVYHHRVPGAQTHMPDGAAIVFRGGIFVTTNEEIIAFLDRIADKGGSMIYTKSDARIESEIKTAALAAASPVGTAKTPDEAIQAMQKPDVKTAELQTADPESQLNKGKLNPNFQLPQS